MRFGRFNRLRYPIFLVGVATLVFVRSDGAGAQDLPKSSGFTGALAHSLVISGDSGRVREGASIRVRSILDTATTTLSRLEVHVSTLAPGGSPHPPHRHPHEELMLIERGTLEVTQEGVVRRAGPGALILQGSNELHGLRNVGRDTATYWVIAIYPRDLRPDSSVRRP